MLSPIDEIISSLSSQDEALASSKLAELTNMDSAALEHFKQVWPTIEQKQRQQIVSRLVELAEDNFELDFDSIFKNCLDDEDAGVRSKAIEGLWENEEPSLINTLLNLFEHDSSEAVRAAAAGALGRFVMLSERQKLRRSYQTKIYQALLAAIKDTSQPLKVKRRALEAIAPMDSTEVGRAISEAYHHGNHKLKVSAIYAMGKNCNPAWLPLLLKELTNTDAEIRYEAAATCGEIGEEEAVPYLIELVNDHDIEVQLAAIRALGKIGGTEAKNCLEQCLDDDNEIIEQAAEQALYELNEGEEPLSFSL
ncbi:MAG: HEAT repeat domain-containing protein [Dehalococcoidales bacterium]|nr:HEAT repeat domain-containing protein [Dehalococcoidales bacterium]